MSEQIPVYQSNHILTAAQLNQTWRSMCASQILGFVSATGLPKPEFNLGSLTTIVKGALVGDLLAREGSGIKVYTALGVLVDEIEWEDFVSNIKQATTTKLGTTLLDKYWIYGFVPTSGTDPDEDVDVSVGKALCEDGSTIVELTSTAGLSYPTLNGGALSNSTTYHLFRYLKDNATYGWHLDTSLTPTISDIESALAYRKIISLKTDASGDLREFIGINENNRINIRFKTALSAVNVLVNTSTFTYGAIEVPDLGSYNVYANITTNLTATAATRQVLAEDGLSGQSVLVAGATDSQSTNTYDFYIKTDETLGFKSVGGSDDIDVYLNGYYDFRNNF